MEYVEMVLINFIIHYFKQITPAVKSNTYVRVFNIFNRTIVTRMPKCPQYSGKNRRGKRPVD